MATGSRGSRSRLTPGKFTTRTRTRTAGQVRTPSSARTVPVLRPTAPLPLQPPAAPGTPAALLSRLFPRIFGVTPFLRPATGLPAASRMRGVLTCLAADGTAVARGLTAEERNRMFRADPPRFEISGTVRRSTQWWMYAGMARCILGKRGIRILEPQLGCGTYGCAFLVDGHPELVLKLTGDRSEAAAAQAVIASGYTDPRTQAIARFLCVYGFLDRPGAASEPLPFFAVLQERLRPTTATEQAWFHTWGTDILQAAQGRRRYPAFRSLEQLRTLLTREAAKTLGPNGPAAVQELWEAVEALDALGINFTDLHGGNVLVAGGPGTGTRRRYKIIDLGVSLTADQQVPALAGARGRRRR